MLELLKATKSKIWPAPRQTTTAAPQSQPITTFSNPIPQHQKIEPYLYQPIIESDNIRLLRFKYSNVEDSSQLEISLTTFNLSHSIPAYHTLSYCWGLQKPDKLVICDGKGIPVTPDLFEGLRHTHREVILSTRMSDQWLWVDQLCINQANHAERGHQVVLMGKIYSQAIRTIVWLGRDDGSAEHAMIYLNKVYLTIEQLQPDHRNVRQFDLVDETLFDRLPAIPPEGSREYKGFQALVARSWFSRLWVIQEIVLSTSDPVVLCGRQMCSWFTLSTVMAWLARSNLRNKTPGRVLACADVMRTISRMSLKHWDLTALVSLTNTRFNSTDDRDKVYSLLGLARLETSFSMVTVDYFLTPEQIYARLTQNSILETGWLSMLNWIGYYNENIQDPMRSAVRSDEGRYVPSWVPDLNAITLPSRLTQVLASETRQKVVFKFPPTCRASARIRQHCAEDLAMQMRANPDMKRLSLQGLQADVVHWSSEIVMPHISILQQKHDGSLREDDGLIGEWYRSEYKGSLSSIIQQLWIMSLEIIPEKSPYQLALAIFYATTAGTDKNLRPARDEDLCHFCAFLSAIIPDSQIASIRSREALTILQEYAASGDSSAYRIAALSSCNYRRCFITKEHRIGIGPTGMQNGDIVSVLFGGGTPYILRSHQGQWLYIGDCYTHGLMQGQAVDLWKQGELKQSIFDLM